MTSPDSIQCTVSCRAIADGLRILADQFEARAARLDMKRRNARFALADYKAIVQAAMAAQAHMHEFGWTKERAARRCAAVYDIPTECVRAHLDDMERRHARELDRKRKRAVDTMTARSIPQRQIAEALGLSQPRVSQLRNRSQ